MFFPVSPYTYRTDCQTFHSETITAISEVLRRVGSSVSYTTHHRILGENLPRTRTKLRDNNDRILRFMKFLFSTGEKN